MKLGDNLTNPVALIDQLYANCAAAVVLFNRFYRVETHHSSEIKGTGLGLSIVKRAVEAHDGTITVTSVPHQKTTFTITIPLKRFRKGKEA